MTYLSNVPLKAFEKDFYNICARVMHWSCSPLIAADCTSELIDPQCRYIRLYHLIWSFSFSTYCTSLTTSILRTFFFISSSDDLWYYSIFCLQYSLLAQINHWTDFLIVSPSPIFKHLLYWIKLLCLFQWIEIHEFINYSSYVLRWFKCLIFTSVFKLRHYFVRCFFGVASSVNFQWFSVNSAAVLQTEFRECSRSHCSL